MPRWHPRHVQLRALLPLGNGPLGPILKPIIGGDTQTMTATQTQTVAAPAQTRNGDNAPAPPPQYQPPAAGGGDSPTQGGSSPPASPGSAASTPPSPARAPQPASGGAASSNKAPQPLLPSSDDPVSPSVMAESNKNNSRPGPLTSTGTVPLGSHTGSAVLPDMSYAGSPSGLGNEGIAGGGNSRPGFSTGGDGNPTNINPDGSPSGPHDPQGRPSAPQGNLGSGAKAAIIFSTLILSVIVVLVVLRWRTRSNRSERVRRWWLTAACRHKNEDDTDNYVNDAEKNPRVLSVRSSFGTTFDRGFNFADSLERSMNEPFPICPIRTKEPFTVSVPPPAHVSQAISGRDSLTGETPVLPIQEIGPESATLPNTTSVSPFSPSESLAFPKPPAEVHALEANSRRSSSSNRRTLTPKTPQGPFSDAHALSPLAGLETVAPAGGLKFPAIEIVHRPFLPALKDELAVSPGDVVRVVKLFDDGWALIEKLPAGNGKKEEVQQGLIPINCMSESGQDLPAFLATKRVSSRYGMWHAGGGKAVGTGEAP